MNKIKTIRKVNLTLETKRKYCKLVEKLYKMSYEGITIGRRFLDEESDKLLLGLGSLINNKHSLTNEDYLYLAHDIFSNLFRFIDIKVSNDEPLLPDNNKLVLNMSHKRSGNHTGKVVTHLEDDNDTTLQTTFNKREFDVIEHRLVASFEYSKCAARTLRNGIRIHFSDVDNITICRRDPYHIQVLMIARNINVDFPFSLQFSIPLGGLLVMSPGIETIHEEFVC